ncbi:MAG: glycine oxidase ThiO [Chloroflexota bacterium]|nr:glycine oxidase ThiO [Chloroflexota bacterium]
MTSDRRLSEVAIVGAGVVGLSCAFELAKRGKSVTVIEREKAGFGASTVAAGMLTPSFEVELTPPELVELQLDSLRRYPGFVSEIEAAGGLSCGYRDEGTLWVSRHRDDELELDHIRQIQEDRGLPAKRLTGRETRGIEPYLSPRIIGGLLVETDHQVNSRKLVPALAAACRSVGVELLEQTGVRSVQRSGGGLQLTLEERDGVSILTADQVLLAAGVWLEEGLVTPLPRIGMRPIKGQIVHLKGQPLVDHVLRNSDVYIVPRAGGELLLGATEEEQGFDMEPTAGGTLDLLRYAFEVLPGLYDLYVSEIDVGLRPAVSDHQPVLGPTDSEGIFIAGGHYRGGVILAPATAHWMAELMTTGNVPRAIEPFGVGRLVAREQEAAG